MIKIFYYFASFLQKPRWSQSNLNSFNIFAYFRLVVSGKGGGKFRTNRSLLKTFNCLIESLVNSLEAKKEGFRFSKKVLTLKD